MAPVVTAANMTLSERLCDWAAIAASPSSSAGSASAEKSASRLAPMPSKLEPVSSAATIVKNRISPSR